MKNPLKKQPETSTRRERLRRDQAGDRQSQSYAYYSRRSDQDFGNATGRQSTAKPAKPNRRTLNLQNIPAQRLRMLALLIFLVVAALYMTTLSPSAQIEPLNENTAALHNTSAYKNTADELLSESIMSKSKATIDGKKISAQLKAKYPELTTVTLGVPLLSRHPVLYIEISQPALVLSASTGSFIVGTSGTILASSTQIASSVRDALPVVSDQSGLPLDLHTRVLASDDVGFMQIVAAQLKAKSYDVSGMTLPKATGELDVQIRNQPYFIKFNLQAKTPKEQVGTYMATISQLQKQKVTPAQYVDVRVDGRAYYK